jgi:hypothetical protein
MTVFEVPASASPTDDADADGGGPLRADLDRVIQGRFPDYMRRTER